MSSSSSSAVPHNPDDSIQRTLFSTPCVHIYAVPPLTSTKGYASSSTWTPLLSPPSPTSPSKPITTRLRVLETSSSSPLPPPPAAPPTASTANDGTSTTKIETAILLEDPLTTALFAAAPYTSPSIVSPVADSARFFALRVEDDGGGGGGGRGGGTAKKRTAVLGIGFEERGEAGDFVESLRGAGRVMGWNNGGGGGSGNKGGGGEEGKGKRDWSLKEGEMIRVEVKGMGGGKKVEREEDYGSGQGSGALFSIKPPPPSSTAATEAGETEGGGRSGQGIPFLPPPPSARDIKAERMRSRVMMAGAEEPPPPPPPVKASSSSSAVSAAELGFDDGEFGEFQ
ncbi:MAG: hypothetical protein Q9219_007155 [cf. Caloplaca sp. 3 TL-2023]